MKKEGIVPTESIWICVAERGFKRQGRNLPCIYRLGHPSAWWKQGAKWNTKLQRKSNAFYGLKVYICTNQLKKARAWPEALSYEQPCCLIAFALPGMIWSIPSSILSSNIQRILLVQRLLLIGKTDEVSLLWVKRKFNHVNVYHALPFATWKRKT